MFAKRMGGLAIAAAVAVTACNDGPGDLSPLDQQINEDVAVVAADAAIEDIQQMNLSLGAVGGAEPSFSAVPTAGSRVITFYDAAGVEMNAFDPLLTASVNIVVEMSGEVTRGDWTASVTRSRDLTVSGLEGEETTRIWNGTGEGTVNGSRTGDGEERSYDMVSSVLIEDVVIGIPRDQNPFPLSGTITRNISLTIVRGDRQESRERTVVIEFDGTQFATLTVNGETFEVDLTAHSGGGHVRKR